MLPLFAGSKRPPVSDVVVAAPEAVDDEAGAAAPPWRECLWNTMTNRYNAANVM